MTQSAQMTSGAGGTTETQTHQPTVQQAVQQQQGQTAECGSTQVGSVSTEREREAQAHIGDYREEADNYDL